jgi:opacity protein-like surface antigen
LLTQKGNPGLCPFARTRRAIGEDLLPSPQYIQETIVTLSRSAGRATLIALFLVVACSPAVVYAQDQRVRVSFEPAVATVTGDAELALGGSVGYRFSDHFWFDGDVTWINAAAGGFRHGDFRFNGNDANLIGIANLVRNRLPLFGRGDFPTLPTLPILPNVQLNASTDGSTFVGTMGVRYELTPQTMRFRPYVAGGLGIDHTDQRFTLSATPLTPAIDQSTSHVGMAFRGGGGASIRVAGQFWADVDASYFHLSRDRDVMRLGGGVSFRF